MDIALAANDESRRAMPGHEWLMGQAKCSYPTLKRRIKALADDGLLKVVRRSAPGIRAVYEVTPLPDLAATWLSVSELRCADGRPP